MPLDQDLLSALKMYGEGVQSLTLSRTLAQANEAVSQIKAQEISEQDKRSRLQDLSNQLVRQLGAQGVDPAKIQQQSQSVSPVYQTPGAAAIAGTLTGDNALVEAAKTADIAAQAGDIEKMKFQQQGAMALQDKKFAQAMLLGKGQKPLNSNEINKLQDYDAVQLTGQNLLEMVAKKPGLVGPIAGRVPGRELVDSDFAVFNSQAGQFFDKYRIAVTGAGASPGELKALLKNVPTGTDTPTNFRKKMSAMLAIGNRVRSRYLDNLSKAGRSVSAFTSPGAGPSADSPSDNTGGDDLSAFIMGAE